MVYMVRRPLLVLSILVLARSLRLATLTMSSILVFRWTRWTERRHAKVPKCKNRRLRADSEAEKPKTRVRLSTVYIGGSFYSFVSD